MRGSRRALVAVAAGLALADASIVALALPPILTELDTSITGAAAVIGVYALVLALALWPVARLRPGAWGFALFAVASLGCGLAGSLELLLVLRAVQAVGGAAALLAAFSVLDAGASPTGRRLWLGAALIGTAAGPAIGGALTEALDWRAIFVVQAPLALAAAVACLWREDAQEIEDVPEEAPGRAEEVEAPAGGLWSSGRTAPPPRPAWDRPPTDGLESPPRRVPGGDGAPSPAAASRSPAARPRPHVSPSPAAPPPRHAPSGLDGARVLEVDAPAARRLLPPDVSPAWLAALALTAAAFTAVLFLLVIELVAGFAFSPLRAALGVTVLPLAALAAAVVPGQARPRALAGAMLIAGGAAALALLPAASIAWTIAPQLLAGAGIGLALPAFTDERDTAGAVRHLVARHAGIVVVLAILAPVATAKLQAATDRAVLQGAALVLDAQLDPLPKLRLAPALLDDVDLDRPRAGLASAVARERGAFAADDAVVYDRLGHRLDDVIVVAVQDAFRVAYLIAAALALLAAGLLATAWQRPAVLLAGAVAAATVLVYAVERDRAAPAPVALQNPCRERVLPDAGGLSGRLQTEALRLLDRGACRVGTSREEFALALFDPERGEQFERDHGVNPRDAGGLLSLLGG